MTEPWSLADVTRLFRSFLGAAAVLFGAWIVASGSDTWSTQQAGIALGIGAVVVAGVGSATWLLAGARRVRGRQRELDRRLRGALDPSAGQVGATQGVALVAARSMTRFHRPTCELVAGKDVDIGSRRQHERTGRQPCGMCEP